MKKPFYSTDEVKDQRRGLVYAICLHVALFLLLLAGLLHTPRSSMPVQIELWAEGDLQIQEEPERTSQDDELDETAESLDEPLEPSANANEAPEQQPDADPETT